MTMSRHVRVGLTHNQKMVHIKCGFPANKVCRELSTRIWISGGYVAPISIIKEVYDAFNASDYDLNITYSPGFLGALHTANEAES